MQWAPSRSLHMSRKYHVASILSLKGEQYQGRGSNDMILGICDEEMLTPQPDVEETRDLGKKGSSSWDQSEEIIEIAEPLPSGREGLRKKHSFRFN